jgi:hypothetical protein
MSQDSKKLDEFLRFARGAEAPTVVKKKTVVKKPGGDDLAAVRSAVAAKPTVPAGTAAAPPVGSSGAPETQPPPRLPDPNKKAPNDHPEATPSVEPGPEAEPGGGGEPKDLSPAEQEIREAAKALSEAKAQQDEKAIAKARTVLVEALRKVGSGG